MGLEPTRTYCPTDFLATLAFTQADLNLRTDLLIRHYFIRRSFYVHFFKSLWSGLSLYHIRNVATQESNFDMSSFQLTVNVLSIILHSIPISNLGITRSVSTRLLEYPSCNLMHHTFYSNRRYLSYPFQPYETSLIPIFARYSPYTLLISAGTL